MFAAMRDHGDFGRGRRHPGEASRRQGLAPSQARESRGKGAGEWQHGEMRRQTQPFLESL